MKSMAKAILFGGLILAAQAAVADGSAFPTASDDAGIALRARGTYAEHRNDGLVSAQSTFPGKAPDGVFLSANVTYASEHAGNSTKTVVTAFPGADDEAGIRLPAHDTYADSHLGHADTAGN